MTRFAVTLVLGLAIIILLSSKFPAYSQDQKLDKFFITTQFCGPWKEVIKTPKKYKEGMLFTGTGQQFGSQNGQMFTGGMFFFVNQETGSYSIINVYSDGMACMMQAGRDFQPYTGSQPWDEKAPKQEGDNG